MASCIKYNLPFSTFMEDEGVSDLDVERAAFFLEKHPDWIPTVVEEEGERRSFIWNAELIDRKILHAINFIGGSVAIYDLKRLYLSWGSDVGKKLSPLSESKERRKPIGVCEMCKDRAAFNVFK
ncbi:hypothetical protein KEJ27_09365 [Candidatus Bathyarchaeota archaeon]|nr:hypothetical protein [Candidatus Bathyarchaeota archaeon]